MSAIQDAVRQDGVMDAPDRSRSDFVLNRSRRGSVASSRFSGRRSWGSSMRDEVQSLDEFLRKQRVIRYMQEERERAARSRLLREEHDAWVEFRDQERTERLKYMTEQEIAELLQREAAEISRESKAAEQSHQRATEDAVRRRQSWMEMRRQEEDAVLARRKSEVRADEARRAAEREAAAKMDAVAEAERAHRASKELRDREEELTAKCKQLERALEEAKAATTLAQRSQQRAEESLAMEHENAAKVKAANQLAHDRLVKELGEMRVQLASAEAEKKREETAKADALRDVARKERELTDLKKHNEELLAVQVAQKAATEAKLRAAPSREESSALKEALSKEKAARSEAVAEAVQLRAQVEALQQRVAAASTPGPEWEAENTRKLNAVAEDARRAQVELHKERQAREKAEAAATEASEALAKALAARDKAEKEARMAPAVPVPAPTPAKKVEADRRKLADAEKKLEEMRRAKTQDEEEMKALRSALNRARRDLESEAAARAQFEHLASQAVATDDRVPRVELDEMRKKLLKAQGERDAARRDVASAQQGSERELGALKAWCERLQEQLRQQQQHMQPRTPTPEQRALQKSNEQQTVHTDDEFTPRTTTPTPHCRTPHSIRKHRPNGLASERPHVEEKAANEQRIRELEAQVLALQDDLKKSGDKERKVLAVSGSAITTVRSPTTEALPDLSSRSPSRMQRASPAEEQAVKDKMAALGKENAVMRGKYEDLLKARNQADVALKSAEKQVEEQNRRILQLEAELRMKEAHLTSPKQAASDLQQREPIAAVAASARDTSALEARIKELEELLKKEREARLAAEKRIEELKKRAEVAEADSKKAKLAAVKAEEKYAAAGAAAESKPKKAKSGCC
ncbi:hypothetical protein ABL78_6615 [Leptomonas seymouri]|uniref:200 kDa antigen p200 n=1 Tax=Leptomonas seymouri TaxID=5684 RepID=A0A0N1I335_LEPSE|nr:hypothetical protein ABL78_6615 [Leptomonas seymouri]|eukprot:KPI84330.1 hypothetical protein ABL78_6615 [Leptomonas seymouri]